MREERPGGGPEAPGGIWARRQSLPGAALHSLSSSQRLLVRGTHLRGYARRGVGDAWVVESDRISRTAPWRGCTPGGTARITSTGPVPLSTLDASGHSGRVITVWRVRREMGRSVPFCMLSGGHSFKTMCGIWRTRIPAVLRTVFDTAMRRL